MLLAASESAVTKKPEVALDEAALVFGQAVRVLPQLDVALHVDFLRHPVVGAAGQVLVPGPLVLERHQLVDVGLAVDDALVVGVHAARLRRRRPRSRLRRRRAAGALATGSSSHDRAMMVSLLDIAANRASAVRVTFPAIGQRSHDRFCRLRSRSEPSAPMTGYLAGFALVETGVARAQLAGRAVLTVRRRTPAPSPAAAAGSRLPPDRPPSTGTAFSAPVRRSIFPRASRPWCAGNTWSSGRAARPACRSRRASCPSARHVDVQRLRLVDPFLAARRALRPATSARLRRPWRRGCAGPAGCGRSCASVPSKYFRSAIMTSSHRPSFFRSRTRYSLIIGEFARQVRLHVQVLERRLDAGRHADDVGDGRGRRDRDAVRVAHAELLDALAHRRPSPAFADMSLST